MSYLYLFFGTLPIVIIGDLLWLGVIAKSFYVTRLGHLMGPVVWPAALLFYLLYVVGIVYFVVLPQSTAGSTWATVAINGALLGFFAYGTYDLTNWATLKDWPVSVVILDMLWGACLTAFVSVVGFLLANHLFHG